MPNAAIARSTTPPSRHVSLLRWRPTTSARSHLNGGRGDSSSTWTLKESYIKARGLGLRLPLDQFAFDIGHDNVGVSFTSPALDHTRWRFASVDAAPDYLIAIGAETGGTALSLRAAAFAPGHREHRA